jgi:hypothetical protein
MTVKTPGIHEPIPDRVIQLFQDFYFGKEMGTLELNPRQRELARRSPAYRALIRSSVDNPGHDDLHSLTLIWERAGSPVGKTPKDWLGDDWHGQTMPDQLVEDRGGAGVFADWDSAGWYAHFIDPENFPIDEVVEQLY